MVTASCGLFHESLKMMVQTAFLRSPAGIEPIGSGTRTPLLLESHLAATVTGFDPATSTVTGWRSPN